jgi:CubicO group peptidase (beta-lactamase class C family)
MHLLRFIFIFAWVIATSQHLFAQNVFNKSGADSLFSHWNNNNTPGGAIAVVKNGKRIYEATYGMANLEKGQRINSETQFWIASVTKQFTAAAIYLLASTGKLDVKQPVTKYLTGLPKIFNEVTIDHLLHHTSGIRDGFVLTALSKKPESEYTNENVLKYLSNQKEINFTPGAQYEYNNSGYVLLAMIIEKVSNETYPEFLLFHIFMPAGMNNTYVTGKYDINEKLATGYKNNNGSFQATHFSGNTYGSTGIITNLRDLELWAAQFQSLSSTNRFNTVFNHMKETAKLNNGQAIAYGGGIEKLKYRGKDVYEHFGADDGFKANIIYFPASNVSIIGLSNNTNDYSLSEKIYKLSDLIHGNEHQPEHELVSASVIGEYDFFDSITTAYRKVALYTTGSAKVSESPDGNAAHFNKDGDWLVSNEVIPLHRFKIEGDSLQIHDIYYSNNSVLKKITTRNLSSPVSNFAGEYYSDELETSYNIRNKDGKLVFEFFPGAEFPLTRITDSTFIFEYAGANYIKFTDEGMLFSREGVRNLKLVRK